MNFEIRERERERERDGHRYDDNDESNITNSKKTKQRKEHEIEIEGLMVKFPFQPYDVQKRFMTATIRAFQKVHILIFLSFFHFLQKFKIFRSKTG